MEPIRAFSNSESKEIKIHIRNIDGSEPGKNLAEWLRVLHTIQDYPKEHKFVISFEICKFLSPFLALPLILLLNRLLSEGFQIRFDLSDEKFDANLKSYLSFVYFPDGFNPESLEISKYEEFLDKYSSKTYIPIVSLPEAKSKEA